MKYFNVSIHDLSSYSLNQVEGISEILTGLKVNKITYLVIPKYHGKDNIIENRDRIKQVVQSHEIAMHGYTHLGKKNNKFSYKKLLTDGEGECISFQDFMERINLGLEVLQHLELRPKGFVPPAWLIKKRDIKLLSNSTFEFLETRYHIYDLKNGKKYLSPVVTFSSRRALQKSSIWANKALIPLLDDFKMIRIAIHPNDIDNLQKIHILQKYLSKLKMIRQEVYLSEFINNAYKKTL